MHLSGRVTDVAVTTYAADLAVLRSMLPPEVEPERLTVDGRDFGAVSAMTFQLHDLGLPTGPLPGPRYDGGHVDHRAYVRHRGERAVWFLGAVMDSAWVPVLRTVWRMPWSRGQLQISADGPGYRASVHDGIGGLELHARRAPAGDHDGIASGLLDNRTVGLYGDTERAYAYRVNHGRLVATPLRVDRAEVGLFETLGLVAAGAAPVSCLAVADFTIKIGWPPRRLPFG